MGSIHYYFTVLDHHVACHCHPLAINRLDGHRAGEVGSKVIKENKGLAIELFVHQHTEDAHLRRTSIEQLLRSEVLLVFRIVGKGTESHGPQASAKVPRIGALLLLPANDLEESANAENGEEKIDGLNVKDGLVTARKGLAAGEAEVSIPRGGVAQSGEHGDAAVLDFDRTETIEGLLVAVAYQVEGIPTDRAGAAGQGGGANLILEGLEGGG